MSQKNKSKKTEQIELFDGCYCSQIKVFPEDWAQVGADASLEWRIWYRFYDPLFRDNPKYKKGKLCVVKGMNSQHTLTGKRAFTADLLKQEIDLIVNQGYNPITRQFMAPIIELPTPEISPELPFDEAMDKALEKKKPKVDYESTYNNLKSVWKYVKQAACYLRYNTISIGNIRRAHVRAIFEQLAAIKGDKWTDNNHNHYLAHLSMLFEELIEWEAMEYNPIDKLKQKKTVRKKQRTLNSDERILIDRHLKEHNYEFWRFLMIFFKAGCRRNEIMKVQAKGVDLAAQKFTALRKKGRSYVEVDYVITNSALPLWRELLSTAEPNDYIFSRGLTPGREYIRPEQVTRRWKLHIKKKFGIEANFYSLKHLHSTMNVDNLGLKVAAKFNNESERMISQHYDINSEARQHELMKGIDNSFVPGE